MSLKLKFLGAAGTVTGSRTLVTYRGKTWLVDCGLFQGAKPLRQRNWDHFTPDPSKLSGILLTHAHLDHSGYLPRICAEGFKGPIYATSGTTDLCGVLLRDAAHLEEEAARFANETGYSNHKPALPLFTQADVEIALRKFCSVQRYKWHPLAEGISFRYLRAGHIIGASLLQLHVECEDGQKVLTFSGDLGNRRSLVLKGPDVLLESDALVIEATYGNRLQPRTGVLPALAAIVNKTFERNGVLVIPAFAVGRAQEVTYMLRQLEDQGGIPKVPVILDSPMASAAMDICLRHGEDHVLDSAFLSEEGDPFRPSLFEVTATPDQSTLACMRDGPMIVISASGMLNGGRILHHLKRRLPDEKNTILFTGYQAEGTKGRFLQDNAGGIAALRIHHQDVPIEAQIVTLDHLSSHADYADILEWLGNMTRLPKVLMINHGTPEAQTMLAEKIKATFGIVAVPVSSQMEFEI